MTTLSQFFGSPGSGGGTSTQQFGVLKVFGSTQSYTIPAEASYVSYATVGGGGGSMSTVNQSGCSWNGSPGFGGGFSYMEGDISSEGAITACVVVGAGGCFSRCDCNVGTHKGGATCISGICLATICGGGGCAGCDCIRCCNCGGGCSGGGMINTRGGHWDSICRNCNWTQQFCEQKMFSGASGAGGFLGDGGRNNCAGGGSGNGGAGGSKASSTNNNQSSGSQGVTCIPTTNSLFASSGAYGSDDTSGGGTVQTMEHSKMYHIPGNLYCNASYYSMGKQMFGAASSSAKAHCYFEKAWGALYDLPGSGGLAYSGCVGSCVNRSGGGFMGGGGGTRCGCETCTAGCGGGQGAVNGCVNPDVIPGGQYYNGMGRGGCGVAYVEYFISNS